MEEEEVEPAPELPSLADGEEHPVDRRTVRVSRVIGFAVLLPVSLLPLAFITIGRVTGGIPSRVYFVLLTVLLALIFSALLLVYKLPAARHDRLRYLVHEEGMRIRRGVLWRKVTWIPISRVQHTDFSQGPIQRRYGLATLTVHTAGTAGASISLAGLEYELASRIARHLRPERIADGE